MPRFPTCSPSSYHVSRSIPQARQKGYLPSPAHTHAHIHRRSSLSAETTSNTQRNSETPFRENPSSSSSPPHPTCRPKHQGQSYRSPAVSWPTTKVLFSLSLTSVHSKTSTVELGLVIGAPGRDISREDALDHIAGYSQSSTRQPPAVSHHH